MELQIDDDEIDEHCEWSKVTEVRDWIKKAPAPELTEDYAPDVADGAFCGAAEMACFC